MMDKIRLSKSALDEFARCPRCFWIGKREGLRKPEGIKAGVPMGLDRVLKAHYDDFRSRGEMPIELRHALPGWSLFADQARLKDMRNWRRGLSVMIGEDELSTALDDLLYHAESGLYAMIDAKSKAKETDVESTEKFYQSQADCYDLALNINGFKTDGDAVFAYYSPDCVTGGDEQFGASMLWRCQVITIKANHDRAKEAVIKAAECLRGPLPESSPSCEFCNYITARKALTEVVNGQVA